MSMVYICFVFCFQQKTADDMRISDGSSDVCSSDLPICLSAADQAARADQSRGNKDQARSTPIRASTSLRERSSSRNTPTIRLVTMPTPGVRTPRAVMQAWVAAMTTAPPCGLTCYQDRKTVGRGKRVERRGVIG